MYHRNIKLLVRKQLKKQYPNWNSLNRENKKEISRQVLAGVMAKYDFCGDNTGSEEELFGMEQQVTAKGIIHAIRNNCDRPFNLLKNQTCLETVRVCSQPATTPRCTIASIALLLIKTTDEFLIPGNGNEEQKNNKLILRPWRFENRPLGNTFQHLY